METRPKRPCWNCGAREAEVLVSRQELCDPCGEMYWRLLLARVAIADAIREDIPGGDRPPRSL
ncbi:MAG TPA: hypothetical protein VNM91_04450, partial [Dehalococcoidia bacterium]|nr:hypothetical protein [Dehalococcoidia bacterium]